MPALPPTPDVFHAAAKRIVSDVLFKVPALGRSGLPGNELVDTLGDVLEELFVRVLTDGLADVVGVPEVDRVTGRPLAVWDVIADLRVRLERVEKIGNEHADRLDAVVEDQRYALDRLGKLGPDAGDPLACSVTDLEDFVAGSAGAHALIFDALADTYTLSHANVTAAGIVGALEDAGADLAGVVYRKDA